MMTPPGGLVAAAPGFRFWISSLGLRGVRRLYRWVVAGGVLLDVIFYCFLFAVHFLR